jgi:rhodanese-related sulfurtransferase
MPRTFIELITVYKETTSLCDVNEAARRIKNESELVIIDVRESAEHEATAIPGAINIPRGFLEFKIGTACPAAEPPILLHCKTGGRAVLAAKTLSEMGYKNVSAYQGTVEDLLDALD